MLEYVTALVKDRGASKGDRQQFSVAVRTSCRGVFPPGLRPGAVAATGTVTTGSGTEEIAREVMVMLPVLRCDGGGVGRQGPASRGPRLMSLYPQPRGRRPFVEYIPAPSEAPAPSGHFRAGGTTGDDR